MTSPTRILQSRLTGARRIALLGVGSELRGDDAFGPFVALELFEFLNSRSQSVSSASSGTAFKVFEAGTVPESLTGELKRFQPTHLVIVDAADFGGEPGEVRLIEPEQADAFSSSTHTLPLSVLVSYLRGHFPCDAVIVGIQPKSTEFGAEMSPEVRAAGEAIAAEFREMIEGFE
jgi:hydrogenase 3 maturation protease